MRDMRSPNSVLEEFYTHASMRIVANRGNASLSKLGHLCWVKQIKSLLDSKTYLVLLEATSLCWSSLFSPFIAREYGLAKRITLVKVVKAGFLEAL